MKRWIKVNGTWIDTLKECINHNYYLEDNHMIYLEDVLIGKLQEESDKPIKNNISDFIKEFPKGGYTKYKEWCTDKPISKKKFRLFKNQYQEVLNNEIH